MSRFQLFTATSMLLIARSMCWADSFETQDNPVANGTIQIVDGDSDRSHWDGIPWYEIDEDFDEFSPVDIDRIQVAHDAVNVYMHAQALLWDVPETWRIGLYVDTDDDPSTGYNGSFLAVGAELLIEAAGAFEFTGAGQAEWGWNPVGDLARDQTEWTDFEVAIPRDLLGGAAVLNFVAFANNMCCDFGLPDDVYPNGGATLGGDYFTYELSDVELTGDFDGSGVLDAPDIDDLTAVVASQTGTPAYDLNNDTLINEGDIRVWIKDLFGSWMGDANLDGEFSSGDLVVVLASGTYEVDANAVWTSGDFNGDGRANTNDLVTALADGGYEQGPAAGVAAAAAVPEPVTGTLIMVGGFIALARGRSSRCRTSPCRSS